MFHIWCTELTDYLYITSYASRSTLWLVNSRNLLNDYGAEWSKLKYYVWGIGVRVRFGVRVSVRVNYFRDSFSVLLRAQHYSMLTIRHHNHSLICMLLATPVDRCSDESTEGATGSSTSVRLLRVRQTQTARLLKGMHLSSSVFFQAYLCRSCDTASMPVYSILSKWGLTIAFYRGTMKRFSLYGSEFQDVYQWINAISSYFEPICCAPIQLFFREMIVKLIDDSFLSSNMYGYVYIWSVD